MMTAHKMDSAKNAKHYFEKDNYYTKDEGIKDSLWMGRGSADLGLSGPVDPEVFYDLLRGKIDGRQLGRKTQNGVEHRAGVDCTFNAPKSVSILTEVLGNTTLREAHARAVTVALRYMEQHCAQARLTTNGVTRFVKTNNLAVAAFTHDTSRELDPHLHTHCVIINATRTAEGWRSLSNELILKMQKRAGAIYRNELASEAVKLGFDLRTVDKGMFELKGFDTSVLGQFSTRREQVLAYIKSHELSYNATTAQVANLATRKTKRDVERASLKALWKEKARRLGLVVATPPNGSSDGERPNLRRSVRYAIRHLSEQEMAFTEAAIIDRLIAYQVGAFPLEAIQKEIRRFRRIGHLLDANDDALTTPYGVRLEREVLGCVHKGFGMHAPFVPARTVNGLLSRGGLDDGQRKAVYDYSQSTDRYFAIRGLAGSGKTTTLSLVNQVLKKAGYRVLGMSPTHVAAKEMSASMGIETKTLDYMLTTRGQFTNKSNGVCVKPLAWIVDEAGFASTKKVRQLMRLAEKQDARVLFVGDHRQLESIEAGRAFKQMQEAGLTVVTLDKIHRQNNQDLLSAVQSAYDEHYDLSLNKLREHVVELDSKEQRSDAIAQAWLRHSKKDRENVLLLTPSNEERKAVNCLVRAGLVKDGSLSGDSQQYRSFENRQLSSMETRNVAFYRLGDVVRFNYGYQRTKKETIAKNEYFDVVGVKRETNQVVLKAREGGRQLFINPNRIGGNRAGGIDVFEEQSLELRRGDLIKWTDNRNDQRLKRNDVLTVKFINKNKVTLEGVKGQHVISTKELSNSHFTYNYANTVFGTQGISSDHVLIMADSRRVNLVNQKSFLVSISRGRESVKIYTDNFAKLAKALRERTGESTTALERRQVDEHMQRRNPLLI